jgi:PncC family amidohydrolase
VTILVATNMATNDISDRADPAAQDLAAALDERGWTVGVAESLTGGLVVQALARVEGSGAWLAGGIVAYQRSVKHDLLGVDAPEVVSGEAAAAMAVGARRQLGADVGLALTGVAGPDRQDGEPPGTVWMAVDLGEGGTTELLRIPGGDAEEICLTAVAESLRFATRAVVTAGHGATTPTTPGPADDGSPDGFWRRNALSLVCFGLFAAFLVAQSLTGWRSAVAEAIEHGDVGFGYWRYLTMGHFAEATFENWESEFLQMGAFVLLTIFLVQRGSSESKQEHDDPRDEDPRDHRHDPDVPGPVRRGGLWLILYENSLLIAFTALFVGSFVGHAVSGAHEFTAEQVQHGASGVGAWQFVRMSEFWFQSFQNWQSEFLAVASIVVLSMFLRQRGSAESKPVHAPHRRTGDE